MASSKPLDFWSMTAAVALGGVLSGIAGVLITVGLSYTGLTTTTTT